MISLLRKLISLLKVIKKKIIQADFNFYKGLKKVDLLIYDNIYPHPVSGFRHEEFTVLLSEFSKSKIIIFPTSYPVLNTPIAEHKKHIERLIEINQSLSKKIKLKKGFVNINTKLFYCVFISNIYDNLNWLEKYKIPFIFTLYPGGGFQVDNEMTDLQLKKVFDSAMFKKVIVTQQFTLDYLISKNFCKAENIEFIFGVVVPQLSLNKNLIDKKSYLIHKSTFDICFCAAKYTDKGIDKGYDVFIDFAHKIVTKYDFIQFHVIGGFTENDIDTTMIKNRIKFYGYQNFEDLSSIYKNMDVLVSPNKPFILAKGAFDGFPLGTVVEASLNGVVSLITDELNQNSVFITNEDFIIIESKSSSIEKEIITLIKQPEKLYLISKKGREKFMKVYSNDVQMKPRVELFKKEIAKA